LRARIEIECIMTLQQQPKPGAAEQQAHAAGLGNDGPQNALEFGQQQQQPLGELIIPEFSAYKATRLQEVVCRRNVRLYRDRLQTIHPELGTERTWYLDRSCRLEPEYVDEVMVEKRTVRSPGQWTVTAKLTTVAGSQAQQTMDLVRACVRRAGVCVRAVVLGTCQGCSSCECACTRVGWCGHAPHSALSVCGWQLCMRTASCGCPAARSGVSAAVVVRQPLA
jgi:hypothetical protein